MKRGSVPDDNGEEEFSSAKRPRYTQALSALAPHILSFTKDLERRDETIRAQKAALEAQEATITKLRGGKKYWKNEYWSMHNLWIKTVRDHNVETQQKMCNLRALHLQRGRVLLDVAEDLTDFANQCYRAAPDTPALRREWRLVRRRINRQRREHDELDDELAALYNDSE